MNIASIQAMVEQATPEEQRQFYAGAQRIIVLVDNRLRQRKAFGARMIEAGLSEQEIELELERNQR